MYHYNHIIVSITIFTGVVFKLWTGVEIIAFFTSRFIHQSKPIHYQYPNQLKNINSEGAVLFKEDEKSERQNTAAVLDHIFYHPDCPDNHFCAAKRYFCVIQ